MAVIFLINLPLAILVVFVALRHVPESLDPSRRTPARHRRGPPRRPRAGRWHPRAQDGPDTGWGEPRVVVSIAVCAVAVIAFVFVERRAADPLVPGRLLRIQQFVAANLVTLALYAAISGALFLLPLELQIALGYSPLETGVALLPWTGVMVLLSARGGRLAHRIGPRLPMTLGQSSSAAGWC